VSEFLVVYDYGMGGVWGFATADAAAEIDVLFPELEIVATKPDWMSAAQEAKTRSVSSFAVGDENTYPEWLRLMVSERKTD
jgi:hypothetical protein